MAAELSSNEVNHSLDLIHAFHPADVTNAKSLFAPTSPFLAAAGQRQRRSEDRNSHHVRSMRFHGRPLELVCAMLRVAYGKTESRTARQSVGLEDLDLDELVDRDMRARLEPGWVPISQKLADSLQRISAPDIPPVP